MDKMVKRLLTVLVSIFLIIYVGYQCVQIFYNPIQTETVYDYNIYDTITTEGIAIREETVLSDDTGGYLSFAVENGRLVSKDGVVARVYADEYGSRIGLAIARLDAEIEDLKKIESQGTTSHAILPTIEKDLLQEIGAMLADAAGPSSGNMDAWQTKLSYWINKRQKTMQIVDGFQDRIAALTAQREALASEAAASIGKITSDRSGYFVNEADGYEDALTVGEAAELDAAAVSRLLSGPPDGAAALPSGAFGKVVSQYDWCFACVLPSETAGKLQEDKSYELLFPFASAESFTLTVSSIRRGEDGSSAVIFKSSHLRGDLAGIRVETAQIRVEPYGGLRVSKDALVLDSEGNYGVYILAGDMISYRKIKVKHVETDYVICETEVLDENGKVMSDYLKLYDEVVVEGKGLYDGKPVG